jgi:hypothetical protein
MTDQPSPAARAHRDAARDDARRRRQERRAARRLADLAPEVEFDAGPALANGDDDALEEFMDRWRIPILAGVAVLLFAGTRFEASRPYEAKIVALGLPLVAVVMGALPLRDAHPKLRRAAFALGGLVLLGSELSVSHALFPGSVPALPALPAGLFLVVLALGAVIVEAIAARRGILTRFAPWVGMTVALSLYLPAHYDLADPFNAVLAGVFVSMAAGGLAGLLLGLGAARLLADR